METSVGAEKRSEWMGDGFYKKNTLPETKMNIDKSWNFQKGNFIFQPLIFKGYVSFREG